MSDRPRAQTVEDNRPAVPRLAVRSTEGEVHTQGWLPPGVRVYAVGDVHGRLDLLDTLFQRIAADVAAAPAHCCRLVMLGDYIDRGQQSRGVIDRLVAGPGAELDMICLRGNHELTMLQFLDDLTVGPGWLSYGGIDTLLSYGVRPPPGLPPRRKLAAIQQLLRQALPVSHLTFLRRLRPYAMLGTYLFVHAGIRPGVALEHQRPDDFVWIRDEFLRSRDDHGMVVVHGHTVALKAESLPNRIGIDTGAYATGRLTAVVLEGASRRFIDTGD